MFPVPSADVAPSAPPLELWAGAECTVNRVGDRFRDQLELTGHAARLADLDRLAALGARAVRQPVLWERTLPDGVNADWSWADARLTRLRALGLRPILGLVHHGSGPAHTSLMDDEFPAKLAAFARAVAARYPWVVDFTPINEPLTTARFSGLYGHWYPHARSNEAFARALVQQCRAVREAMTAIRTITPAARLVQTEDMGTIFSTRRLAYQARFENERRWLSIDLLTGRVGRSHPLRRYLRAAGVRDDQLAAFEDEPCAPDILGLNYYVTSDRFLDHRLERYPSWTHGGNGKHAYADVEAVRVRPAGIVGHAGRLREAWDRHRLPLAFTEVHLGCTREEQLRWLKDAWQGANAARALGVDVRAVTMWSAFGAVDWDSLLVHDRGNYEPGAYDVRGAAPRATALVALARELSSGGTGTHPVLDSPGWWQDARRFTHAAAASPTRRAGARVVLITGATGTLGAAFARACDVRGIAYRLVSRQELDIADAVGAAAALDGIRPWAVINAAGYARVDDAEKEPARCLRENTAGSSVLARACGQRSIPLVSFSSDLVFGGSREEPYVESDPVGPCGVYASSKARAEEEVQRLAEDSLIIRSSSCFGGGRSMVDGALSRLAGGRPVMAPDDIVSSAMYMPDLVRSALDLLIDGERGIWHFTNRGAATWFDLVQQAAHACHVHTDTLVRCRASDLRLTAPRPTHCVLGSEKTLHIPPLPDALERFSRHWAA